MRIRKWAVPVGANANGKKLASQTDLFYQQY